MAENKSWLGDVRGHVSELNRRLNQDRKERRAAGRAPIQNNVILKRAEIENGALTPGRVLMTTLNGQSRPLTVEDLDRFRSNMRIAEKEFGVPAGGGILAQQILNLASSRPLNYLGTKGPRDAKSDLDKARHEIATAMPVSALNDTIRFVTPAGKDSKRSRHVVIVKLTAWDVALGKAASVKRGSKGKLREIADWLRRQPVRFDCDCERHRYFFRYVATIGGFHAGRREDGYPKIRNPKLRGVACKHVLRVMTELLNSPGVLRFLVRHLQAYVEKLDDPTLGRASTTLSQKEAEEELKKAKSHTIRTSEQQAKADARQQRANTKQSEKRKQERAERERREISLIRTKKPSKTTSASKGVDIESMSKEQLLAFIKAKNLNAELGEWSKKRK